ncbi:MAG: xanthine dehydrogenase family protein molybdopterin-binding subunit, partial [Pseudomonadota bacterium]
MPGQKKDRREYRSIGKSVRRVGAGSRLSGKALYAADMETDGVLTLAAFRSDRPHALIRELDVSVAKEVPGCVGVFTAEDIPGRNRYGIINKDQRLLAHRKVRHVGDPIALVAAESPDAAEAALRRIRCTYQDLPAVFDPEEALRQGAPEIHEGGNLLVRKVVKRGNPDKGFEEADVVIERVYTTSHIEHTYLEPDAGLGYLGDDETIVIHASTQNPHYDQKDVADLLGLDERLVRIIQAATGGGFGSKLDLNVQGFIALAVHHLRRPVRMVYSREEAFLCTAKRHPMRIRYKSGATSDGRLIAVDVRVVGDTGAYASYGLAVCTRVAAHACGPYEVPNVYVESTLAYTNNPIAGAMRGFGVPQIAFAHESQMDLLAEALQIDPVEIRLRNCFRVGSVTQTGQQLSAGVGIGKCLKAIAPYYRESHAANSAACSVHSRRGTGIGAMWYGIGNTGMRNPSTARVELDRDGRVTLFSGAADIGQGSCTVLRQIAAEALGLDPESIRLVTADTLHTTSAGATSASRQTYISGNAVLDAARKLADVLLSEAAMIASTDRRELVLTSGEVRSVRDPDVSVSFQRIAQRAYKTGIPLSWQGYFDPDTVPLDPDTGQGVPYGAYAYAAQMAEVEVDVLTGEVTVLRVVAAHDVGKAIHPENVRGQINSGVAMGIGMALMEEYIPGVTESMKDYHIPTCADVPPVTTVIIEDPEPSGPFGAKGVGEPALIPTAPAIANA